MKKRVHSELYQTNANFEIQNHYRNWIIECWRLNYSEQTCSKFEVHIEIFNPAFNGPTNDWPKSSHGGHRGGTILKVSLGRFFLIGSFVLKTSRSCAVLVPGNDQERPRSGHDLVPLFSKSGCSLFQVVPFQKWSRSCSFLKWPGATRNGTVLVQGRVVLRRPDSGRLSQSTLASCFEIIACWKC